MKRYNHSMGSKGKHRLLSKELRKQLAVNLTALMKAYADVGLGTPGKVAVKAKVGRNTVKRMADGMTGCTIETLEAVASVFPVEPWQMLVPGMKTSGMPLLAVPDASQKAFYNHVDDLMTRVDKLESEKKAKPVSARGSAR